MKKIVERILRGVKKMPTKIDFDCCIGCMNCVEDCPEKVYDEGDEYPVIARPENCTDCGICVSECPEECIELNGLPMISEKDQQRRAEEEEERQTAVAALLKEREESLRKIIQSYEEIPLELIAEFLQFEDTKELQRWIISLPGERSFYIKGKNVIIPKELQSGTTETEEAIEKLLKTFEDYEKRGRGKK